MRPAGGTPTGQCLNQILRSYLHKYEANPETTRPLNIMCITDAQPSDDIESRLTAAAKRSDELDAPAWTVGVQFFQVGQENVARDHLKQLDDELVEIAGDDNLHDIVDTAPNIGTQGVNLTAE
ncbi:hypothetical protein LTR86_011292, partial [Recurvomyces mirabilis]